MTRRPRLRNGSTALSFNLAPLKPGEFEAWLESYIATHGPRPVASLATDGAHTAEGSVDAHAPAASSPAAGATQREAS